ncbi:hypothetical protein WJX73_009326 [Symbiochloris irregularis]|uniref:Uncharacterized protein n=1 Tax=Symbiochloris irregularis TaxID=706552 RepID=A0AAW1P3A2_9CHLO
MESQMTSQGLPVVQQSLLVGSAGQEFISRQLAEASNIEESVKTIQARGTLTDKRTRPLLTLLDLLNLTRAQALKGVLQSAKAQLFALLPKLPQHLLMDLLRESFPYIGLLALRDIPLTVLDLVYPVPASFLKQIAADPEIFTDLPIGVQRQVWESDTKLLQMHAMTHMAAYVDDITTVRRAFDMDQFLTLHHDKGTTSVKGQPPSKAQPPSQRTPQEDTLLTHYVVRRQQRVYNASLQRLVNMVGKSQKIYKGLAQLCSRRLKDSQGLVMGMQESALCMLRSQLLMALHDANGADATQQAFDFSQEPCHRLAWTLDACINAKTLDDKRLSSLQSFFAPLDRAPSARSAPLSAPPKKRARSSRMDGDAESQGVPGGDGSKILGDAAMILRDLPALYFFLHQALGRLKVVLDSEGSPSDDGPLVFLTRLMQLACSARMQLREQRFSLPQASPQMMSVVYPALMGALMDAEGRSDPAAVLPEDQVEQLPELVGLLTKDEVVRKITQCFVLERLGLNDLGTAQVILTSLQEALARLSDKAIPEWTPFAITLAQRMVRLVKGGTVGVSHPLWGLILDSLLMRLVLQ